MGAVDSLLDGISLSLYLAAAWRTAQTYNLYRATARMRRCASPGSCRVACSTLLNGMVLACSGGRRERRARKKGRTGISSGPTLERMVLFSLLERKTILLRCCEGGADGAGEEGRRLPLFLPCLACLPAAAAGCMSWSRFM